MKWTEKVASLVSEDQIYAIEKEAKWSQGDLKRYLKRGTEPGAYAAFRLAQAIGVPLDWLFNEEDKGPPPNRKPSVDAKAIMAEVGVAILRSCLDQDLVAGVERVLNRAAEQDSREARRADARKVSGKAR